jgi:hypothetical protein
MNLDHVIFSHIEEHALIAIEGAKNKSCFSAIPWCRCRCRVEFYHKATREVIDAK